MAAMAKVRLVEKLSFTECIQNEVLKSVRGKIWEIKVSGHQTRLLGFPWRDCFVVDHVVIKKQDSLDNRDIDLAEERRLDWIDRYGR